MAQHIDEKGNGFVLNGYIMLVVFLVIGFASAWIAHIGFGKEVPGEMVKDVNHYLGAAGVLGILASYLGLTGLYRLEPNQAVNFNLFGTYAGTARDTGLEWTNPFYIANKVSLRKNTLLIDPIKVNDKRGNPVEIGAAIDWEVENPAQVEFGLNMKPEAFVEVQTEVALRNLASRYPYDHLGDASDEKTEETLRENSNKVAEEFLAELLEIMKPAGVNISKAKITHLAYAPEIAGVMLKRQQAEAVIAARKKIVIGAVEMVHDAMTQLEGKGIKIPDNQKAPMVSNLMTVLCSEQGTQAVVSVDRQG